MGSRLTPLVDRGFFGIGIWHPKSEANIGTLWRSAHTFGASFIYTIGRRYRPRQASDTTRAYKSIPLYHYDDIEGLVRHLPVSCPLIGIELDPDSVPLVEFKHPERACYLLGAEDHGLSQEMMDECHRLVQLPGAYCMNVSTAGSIVMYDRVTKRQVNFGASSQRT